MDWRNNNMFATCSTDTLVFLFRVGEDQPFRRFEGHTSEVNTVKWDPTGRPPSFCIFYTALLSVKMLS